MFTGRFANGHTGSVGISSTTSFYYAYQWQKEAVYVLDLRYHPFALDVNETQRIHLDRTYSYQIDDSQYEINIANNVMKEMIVGVYLGEENKFVYNSNYDECIAKRLSTVLI
jgi:hypothetical protein